MHMGKIFDQCYIDIISLENLLEAWREFVGGKHSKRDVQAFEMRLMENLIDLHQELTTKTYRHGSYKHFRINDSKPRDIHKASVRDRLVHHAIYRVLYPFFDRTFIPDSFSCRIRKGAHRALGRFEVFARKVSKNNTETVWVLKCDIRKFFASIDHRVLLEILRERIADEDVLRLLGEVIGSFSVNCHPGLDQGSRGLGSRFRGNDSRKDCLAIRKGLPLGNLTSQLLANVYLNELDQFVKRQLKERCYIRYADDFVLFSRDYEEPEGWLISIKEFLEERLNLKLHPDKVSIKTVASGADFLGWVHFPDHRVLRTATKRRMFRKGNEKNVSSYFGLLAHGNARKLERKFQDQMNGS